MTAFTEFMKSHWFEISTGIAFIIEIVFIFVKRKPKSIDDFRLVVSELLAAVPDLVISRERPGNGEVKKKEVIVSCLGLASRSLGRVLTEKEKSYLSDLVSEKIETVLSTPTKKEIVNEK